MEQIHALLQEAFRHDFSYQLYLLMFAGGLLASVTPCTYPVLPLTIGYIGNRAGGSRSRAFLLSLCLVAGMATVYALLGCGVALLGGTFGSLMGNGWFLFAVALFFLIMGLGLLDVFSFPTWGFFARFQPSAQRGRGIGGAFLVGGVSGLIVGPCTGPILAVALGAMALNLKEAHGVGYLLQIVQGGLLLFLFGFGQGALILLAGLFTGFLTWLPKSGAWLEKIKKGFALLVIFASALLFIYVGQNTDFPNITRLLAGAPTVKEEMKIEEKEVEATPKALAILKEAERPGNVPAAQTKGTPPKAEKPRRQPQRPAIVQAPEFALPALSGVEVSVSRFKGQKGIVLVFFATWCVNCMEEVPEIKAFADSARPENVLVIGINYKQSAEIVQRFRDTEKINYGLLLDEDGKVTTDLFGITGLPHIIGIDMAGRMIYRGAELPSDRAEFLAQLKKGA